MADRISRDEVVHVARLARLSLGEEEVELYSAQLAAIIDHIGEIRALDLSSVPPMSHSMEVENVWRDDDVGPCLARRDVLAGAPSTEAGRFRVPRILEEE